MDAQRHKVLASFDLQSLMIRFNVPVFNQVDATHYQLDQSKISLFMHEYLHYYHYFNTHFFAEGFYYYLRTILELARDVRATEKLSVPYKYHGESVDWECFFKWQKLSGTEENILSDEIIGVSDSVDATFSHAGIPTEYQNLLKRSLPIIKLKSGREYVLGECAINEGISYNIDRILTKQEPNVPDFPYRAINKLSYYLLHREINPINLVLICDRCLQTYSPGELLLYFLTELKGSELLDNTVKLKKYLYSTVTLNPRIATLNSMLELDLLYLLYDSKEFGYHQIFRFLIGQILKWLPQNRMFDSPPYLDVISPSGLNVQIFNELVHKFRPAPLIIDPDTLSNGDYKCFYPKHEEKQACDAYMFLLSIKHLLNILLGFTNQVTCPFIQFCKHPTSYKDENCQSAPWLHGRKTPSCQMGFASSFLGIQDLAI